MIIRALKLTNFGGHKELHLEGLTSMVGIVGPSGGGKTTVLEAIEVLFRGIVEGGEAMETYIRDFGSPYQAETCMVEGWIEAVGGSGYLMRSIGAGTKKNARKFIWNDETMTAESKIAAKLEELFDLGRKALISQAFQKQGEMYRGLFTTSTQREDYILKLRNLSHYGGVSEAVTKERAKLLADLPDMTPAMDQATYTYGQARQEADAAEAALKLAYDYAPDIKSLQLRDQYQRTVAGNRRAFAQSTSNLDAARQSLDNQLAATGVTDVAALKVAIEDLRALKDSTQLALSNLESRNALVKQRDQVVENLTAVQGRIDGLNGRIPGLKGLANPEEEQRLQVAIQGATRRAALETRISNGKALVETTKAKLAAIGTRPDVEDTVAAQAAAQETIELYKPSLTLWDTLSRAGIHQGDCECPTCHQDASKVLPDTKVIEDARAKMAAAHQTITNLASKRLQQETAQRTWDTSQAQLTRDIASYENALAGIEVEYATTSPGDPVELLQTKLANLQNFARQLATAEAELRAAEESKAQLETRKAGFPVDIVWQPVTDAQAAFERANAEFTRVSGLLSTLSTTVDHHSRMEAVFQSTQAALQEAERALGGHLTTGGGSNLAAARPSRQRHHGPHRAPG